MSDKTLTIQKLGGDLEEALLRFAVPIPQMGVVDCYLENDQLTNLAHVLSKFLQSPDSVRTSYTLGSFKETNAGGALQVSVARDHERLLATIDIIDEESKGIESPRRLVAEVSPTGLEKFSAALTALHHAESGVATLHLRQA
jgi:hypothetical protein